MTLPTAIARLFDEVWNGKRLEVIDEVVAENLLVHRSDGEFEGRKTLKDGVAYWQAAFPDMVYQVESAVTDGDHVATRWRGEGSHQGEFLEIPATGRPAVYWGITLWRLTDGVIEEAWVLSTAEDLRKSLAD